ncbi:MAG: beta-propeller fold lactonase family protein [Microbacterium sp.]
MRFLLGGYTAEMEGRATGIGMLRAGAADDVLAGGALAFEGDAVAASGSPSWLTAHPTLDVVYAALEGAGTVQAFRRTGETTWAPLGDPVPAGEIVCHVAVAPDGGSLVADCWGDGTVARMPLDAEGRPSAPQVAAAARDPYGAESAADVDPELGLDLSALLRGGLRETAGQPGETTGAAPDASRSSRAHAAAFLPDGRVATTDLGFDLVRVWRPSRSGLCLDHEVVLPRGSGPRHLVVHPSGHLYIVTEYSCEVFVLAPAPSGRWALVGGVPAAPAALPDDAAAELAASRDGAFLYAGLRGSNTIATLRVRGAGETLEPVALVDSGVDWPRHHVVARDTLLVVGQRSDTVTSLALDLRTGVPGRARHRVEAPSPSCLLPVR